MRDAKEKIIVEAERLTYLLTHPEQGIASWHEACERVYQRLVAAAAMESPYAIALQRALRDVATRDEARDGEPCWCDDEGRHEEWCLKARAALAKNPAPREAPALAPHESGDRLRREEAGPECVLTVSCPICNKDGTLAEIVYSRCVFCRQEVVSPAQAERNDAAIAAARTTPSSWGCK